MQDYPPYETINVASSADGVVLCTFNRPEVRNALNAAMVQELDDFVARTQADHARVVVFTGGGDKAFIGGADIRELRVRKRHDALRFINNGLFRRIERLQMPTIAAIRGFALGGGCELALACDMRICGKGAKLGQPEVALGIIPGAGATYRLSKIVGPGRARELIFTGRLVDADEALRIGLVNQVVPDAEVVDAARALAATIIPHSSWAIRLAKLTLGSVDESSVDACMTLEATAQAILFGDADKQARMDAFLARRKGARA